MKKTKEEAEKTKELILKAAICEISEKGYTVTRLEDIAKKANVTRGAIYHYYKNKNAILYDIHEKNKKRVQAIIEALEDGGDTILKMKQAFIEMFARFEIDQEFRQVEEVFLKIEFAAIIREDADLREKFHKSRSEMQENLLKIIRNGQKSGSIRLDINPENIALAITSFYIGLSTLWFTKIVEFSIKEKAKDYIDILFNGILNNN